MAWIEPKAKQQGKERLLAGSGTAAANRAVLRVNFEDQAGHPPIHVKVLIQPHADDALRAIHDVAGGQFYAIGKPVQG